MRYALVSDIHANLQAWKAVQLDLASAGANRVICLGDVVGYGPNPADVLESVYGSVHHFLLGNHDAALCGKMDTDLFTDRARILIEWTRSRLASTAPGILAEWPLTLRGRGFRCAHGDFSAPGHFRYILEPEEAAASWAATPEPLLFVGHSHCPGLFVLGASGTPHRVDPQDFVLEPGKRYLVNVGSVGQPRDGDPRASYCLYDTREQTVCFRRIPFDLDQYRRAIADAGLTPDSSPFLEADPRGGVRPIRPLLGFHPPEDAAHAARNAVPGRDLETLKRSVRFWRLAALLLGIAAIGVLGVRAFYQWRNRADGPILSESHGPAPRVAAHYSTGVNLLVLPTQPVEAGAILPGWAVRLGSGLRQSVAAAPEEEEGRTLLRLRSTAPDRKMSLSSPDIRTEPGQRFMAEAYFRKSENFRGRVWMCISVDRRTDSGIETLEQFIVKEPNLRRRDGWMAARETFALPAGSFALRFQLHGQFEGEAEISQITLQRR
ncbi:MAG: metallophosphoesterase family protein [Kiritimatiellia bacterium]|nr:metallophosphoesterase family protein [Kiritimatiellia bacterium]